MEKFSQHTGVAAPMLKNNIDTDAIIPSREIQGVSKRGLSDGLFAGWRYLLPEARTPNPGFVLNQPGYKGASILLSGSNFGCGSSREHAVWALKEFGFRVIIAASFGTIFQNNCVRNGILPIIIPLTKVEEIATRIDSGGGMPLCVDLPEQSISLGQVLITAFDIDPADKHTLLSGLDPIAATERHNTAIQAFAAEQQQSQPWIAITSTEDIKNRKQRR